MKQHGLGKAFMAVHRTFGHSDKLRRGIVRHVELVERRHIDLKPVSTGREVVEDALRLRDVLARDVEDHNSVNQKLHREFLDVLQKANLTGRRRFFVTGEGPVPHRSRYGMYVCLFAYEIGRYTPRVEPIGFPVNEWVLRELSLS